MYCVFRLCQINYYHTIPYSIRLTPLYGMVILLYTSFYHYAGSGPLFTESFPDAENCRTYWWTNILYINNLVHTDKAVSVHTIIRDKSTI